MSWEEWTKTKISVEKVLQQVSSRGDATSIGSHCLCKVWLLLLVVVGMHQMAAQAFSAEWPHDVLRDNPPEAMSFCIASYW